MSERKNEDEKTPEFSVRDRRRISLEEEGPETAEKAAETAKEQRAGEERQESPPGSAGPTADEMRSAEDLADAAAKSHRPAPEVDFTTFVISLASSAMVHMGHAAHPESGEPQVNLPMAKQVVDMLAMLKEKTRGNLEPDEDRYLEAILYDLRIRFVEATKAKKK